ncbi:MAG TPA: 23S rRNA (pseudouridine(1915)-N(3))-methyltransferase RlmH [Terriglobales bacterium]|nr:23S rRNA (pseudouridine(1915)-N(3))-methyltransferase RlmH [Terriglobales bacterium]
MSRVRSLRPVKITIAWIGKTRQPAIQVLTEEYVRRISQYTAVRGLALPGEGVLLGLAERHGQRPAHALVLLDSRGRQFSSEEFAQFLTNHEEHDSRPLVLAVGPADGFSEQAVHSASFLLSLGKMTLSHELARVVLLEQVYRALTIRKGHPYHLGH